MGLNVLVDVHYNWLAAQFSPAYIVWSSSVTASLAIGDLSASDYFSLLIHESINCLLSVFVHHSER